MKLLSLSLFFTGIFFMTANSQAQVQQAVPAFVAETLAKHACWQTSVFMVMGNSTLNMVSKKWAVQKSDVGLALAESSASSLIIKNDEGHWGSAYVQFPQGPSIQDLTNFPFNTAFTFSQQSQDRLLATTNVGFEFKVLFFPASCSQVPPATYKGDIGFAETPFGFTAPPAPYESTPQTQYLHHRKNSTVLVRLDESFPDLFITTAKRALATWNAALGWEVYKMAPQKEKLNALDCLSSKSLCLFWEGQSDNLGWIGWGGLTGLNFDPVSGEIIGATISFVNASPGNLEETPKDILEEISQNFNMDFVARIVLRKEEFRKYAHPFPQQLFEHLILHEMGHANGMKHDFRGSLGGSPKHPSNTVMEYLPFIVADKANYLGSKDMERLNIVYNNAIPKRSLKTCSDAEAAQGFDPSCLQNDLGEPAQWYMRLANLGEKNVFTVVSENQSGLPIRYYIDMLGKFVDNPFVATQQAKTVSDYLCRLDNKTEVQTYLSTMMKKTLACP